MITEAEAIEIATKFVEEKKINCRFDKALPPIEKIPKWQIEFLLILPENYTVDPDIVVVEIDESGNASFLGMI